jgi:hypothetical protein
MDNNNDEEIENDSKGNYIGIIIFVVSLLLVWAFVSSGSEREPTQYTPPVEPSKEQLKQWTKDYYENGNTDPDIDFDQQYGGK